jgi:hypothetical protein
VTHLVGDNECQPVVILRKLPHQGVGYRRGQASDR